MLTAVANDYGYEDIFRRQLRANSTEGDVFIAISTSGNSKNIVSALAACKDLGLVTIGLTGGDGGQMSELCQCSIVVPSSSTPRIQESHITIGHILCGLVEQELFLGDVN